MAIKVKALQNVERLINDLKDNHEDIILSQQNAANAVIVEHAALNQEDYAALIEGKFELPVFNKFHNHFEIGTYHCKLCHQIVAKSQDKYEANTGRPTFKKLITKNAANYQLDNKLAIPDVAVYCQKCNSFLGYVYDDGLTDTNLRYSLNSQSLIFKAKEENE